jgi:hypothetical protein
MCVHVESPVGDSTGEEIVVSVLENKNTRIQIQIQANGC